MKQDRHVRRRGFSLIELLIVMAMLTIILGLIGSVMISVQRQYVSQQALIEAQNNARVAMDMLLRLIRVAGNNPQKITFEPIHPDPDGNSALDSIRLRADWNPGDGALDDPYEDMVFTVSSGLLYVQQPSDVSPVEFVDRVQSLAFSYLDKDGNAIGDPVADRDKIAHVDVTLLTLVPEVPAMTFNSSATIRTRD